MKKKKMQQLVLEGQRLLHPVNTIQRLPNHMTIINYSQQHEDKLSVLDKKEDEYWTAACLEEQLFLNLASIRCQIKVVDSQNVTKLIHYRRYYRQALNKMYRIPVWNPSSPFIIYFSDLTDEVKQQLLDYYKTGYPKVFRHIVTQAVGRIFENLNFEYYHCSVARHLRVKIEK
jgi:hypothetical protein